MAPKRKRDSKSSVKKQRKTADQKKPLSKDEILKLSDEIFTSSKHYNNFVSLIEQLNLIKQALISEEDEEVESLGRHLVVSLYKCFQKVLQDGGFRKSSDEKKQLVAQWLNDKYESFKVFLRDLVEKPLFVETSLQLDALDIYLNLVKLESEHMRSSQNDSYFATLTYKLLVESLLLSENGSILNDGSTDNFIILEFIDKFSHNWDLQFYFVNNLHETIAGLKDSKTPQQLQLIFANFYTIMKNKLLFNQSIDELKEAQTLVAKLPSNVYKPAVFKSQFQKSFVTILSYPILTCQYKSTLLILHKRIIPNMAQPQALMDFLTDSYDVEDDSVVPILALNSLYELMKRYNLEYPDFYTKLYSLLTPSLLYNRHRARFFRLCDLFLSSSHLSSNVIASFIKKLARLSLTSSASGSVIVIPFIYNLLKKHPSCMVLIHNSEGAKDENYKDTFDDKERDPLKTQAMGSSLWELETLMSHYHPNIATLAKIFSEPFRKPSYNMEDFLDWSYISLLDSEKTRKYKGVAALEYEEWDSVFDSKANKSSSYLKGWAL